MIIYGYDSYKLFLRDLVESRKLAERQFSYAKLAQKIGVQRSYLSRVLNGDASLNADQLFLLSTELNILGEERKYLLLLLELDRCHVPARRLELAAECEKHKKEKLRTEAYMKRESIAPSETAFVEYYGNALVPIVHMFLTIPAFLKDPEGLCDRLQISRKALGSALQTLERCDLLRLEKTGYQLVEKDLFLSARSNLWKIYGTQFRLKSIEYHQKTEDEHDYFFTASFSANEELRQRLRQKLKDLLEWLSPLVEKSHSEEVFHLNLDLFKF